MKGILLDDNNDLKISVKRNSEGKITSGLVVGERLIQDAYMVLTCNQGEIKEDPIVGANLVKLMRGSDNKEKIRKTIEISLKRVNINLSDIESQLQTYINGKQI